MDSQSLIDRVQAFLSSASDASAAEPVRLEYSGEGPYVKMKLGLGVYDVSDPTRLNVEGPVGQLIPEILNLSSSSDEEEPPLVTEVQSEGWRKLEKLNKRLRKRKSKQC